MIKSILDFELCIEDHLDNGCACHPWPRGLAISIIDYWRDIAEKMLSGVKPHTHSSITLRKTGTKQKELVEIKS